MRITQTSLKFPSGHQGCILHPHFNIDIDYLMGILEQRFKAGIELDQTIFQDLKYADDMSLLAETVEI